MQHRKFAKTKKEVSEVGLGTWQLGGSEWGDVSEDQALATLAAAVESGVTFFDTADIYGGGRSEELLGRFLKEQGDRERFFIATKFGRRPDPGWPDNFLPATVRSHVDDSLQRMGLERIDLVQTHCVPMEHLRDGSVWDALRELQAAGKIGGFGASVESMEEALECIEVDGIQSLQIIFNPFRLKPAEVLFHAAREKQIALIARLPLASGLLSGKISAETVFPENDHRNFNRDGERFNVGETFAGLRLEDAVPVVQQFQKLAGGKTTLAQWALRWALDHEEITTVIPGAKRPGQVQENAAASDLQPLSSKTHATVFEIYYESVRERIRGVY
jgi:aryl-alcohol dehydrogenase-like predicted oxidoreductase